MKFFRLLNHLKIYHRIGYSATFKKYVPGLDIWQNCSSHNIVPKDLTDFCSKSQNHRSLWVVGFQSLTAHCRFSFRVSVLTHFRSRFTRRYSGGHFCSFANIKLPLPQVTLRVHSPVLRLPRGVLYRRQHRIWFRGSDAHQLRCKFEVRSSKHERDLFCNDLRKQNE